MRTSAASRSRSASRVYRRGDTAGSLVDRADQALMQAKRDGRNRTVTEEALEPTRRVA